MDELSQDMDRTIREATRRESDTRYRRLKDRVFSALVNKDSTDAVQGVTNISSRSPEDNLRDSIPTGDETWTQ